MGRSFVAGPAKTVSSSVKSLKYVVDVDLLCGITMTTGLQVLCCVIWRVAGGGRDGGGLLAVVVTAAAAAASTSHKVLCPKERDSRGRTRPIEADRGRRLVVVALGHALLDLKLVAPIWTLK